MPGAPWFPGSLPRTTTSGAGMPPMSPANVSAPGIIPDRGPVAGMGDRGVHMGGAPVSLANTPAPSIAPCPDAAQSCSALANTIRTSQTTVRSRGVAGKRISPPPEHDSNKQPRTAGHGTSTSISTGGRRKGQLTQQASTCHGWCRTNRPVGNVRHACQQECNYWLCEDCMRRWTSTRESFEESEQSGGFWCCLHGGRQWCPCFHR